MKNYSVIMDAKHPIKMWTEGVPVEEDAIQQLRNVANLPFIRVRVKHRPLGRGSSLT